MYNLISVAIVYYAIVDLSFASIPPFFVYKGHAHLKPKVKTLSSYSGQAFILRERETEKNDVYIL